jgi:DNA-directed RNA polymerase specialized sigma24 family protein
MMDCHKCPHAKKVKAGAFAGRPWKSVPCSKCESAKTDNHHGRTHVPFDDKRGLEGCNVHPVFESDPPPARPGDPSVEAMAHIAKAFLALEPKTREIVLDRLANPYASLRIVANRLRLPISTVHDRLKRARQEWPALAYAIPMKDRASGGRIGP